MALVLKSLDDGGTERRIDGDKAFTIGRGTDNDLVIVDPAREVSKTHCRIERDGEAFKLTDLSINGVVIEGQSAPMSPGTTHKLVSGDVLVIGPQRFGVTLTDAEATAPATMAAKTAAAPETFAPKTVSHILDGVSEGEEPRASAGVTCEAHRWLGTLPTGSATETLHQPLGWDGPPATAGSILPPDVTQPTSDFADRSEHAAAPSSALHLPRVDQIIPMNWLDDEPTKPVAQPAMATAVAAAADRSVPGLRQALAEGGRLDANALAGLTDRELMQRCGEALRAFIDALDTAEAAQAVAERDCGLPTPSGGALWTDFLATNRDPLLSVLIEPHPGPAEVLAQRVAALAHRQRALGRAVAEAAERYDAALSPAAIAAETRRRFRFGPFAKAAAWKHFVGLRAELAAEAEAASTPSFLVFLRRSFARAVTNWT